MHWRAQSDCELFANRAEKLRTAWRNLGVYDPTKTETLGIVTAATLRRLSYIETAPAQCTHCLMSDDTIRRYYSSTAK